MEERKYRRPELRVLYLDKTPRIVRVLEDLSDKKFERYRIRVHYDQQDYEAIYEVKHGDIEGELKTLDGIVIRNIYGLVGDKKRKKGKVKTKESNK